MKKMLVCVLLVALIGLPLFAAGGSQGGASGQMTMTFASSQPPQGGFMGGMALEFARILAEESNGAINVVVHHSGALSTNERELLEMAQAGSVDFAMGATTYMLGWSPSMRVFDLPFLFESVQHFRNVVFGPVGEIMERETAQHGAILLGQILPGFRSIFTTRREIRSINDLSGLKIRTMESPIYLEMFRSLDMLPTPMPSSELFTALQTGVVDAGENDPASVVSWGWVDIINYYMLNQHTISSNVIVMNKARYDNLTPALQQAVRRTGVRAVDFQLAYIQQAWEDNLKIIRDKGVTVVELSPAEVRQFQDRVQHLTAQWDREIGGNIVQMVRDAARR